MFEILSEEESGIPGYILTQMDFHNPFTTNGSSFVIVEGEDDRDIYSRFFDYPDTCKIVFANGRKYVEAVIPNLPSKYSNRTLGIVDCDFDYAFPDKEYPDNLIVTETHDLETFILSSPAFNALLDTYCDKKKGTI